MALPAFLRIAEKGEPGPSPRFGAAHALLAFIVIGSAGTIGRQALARSSGLGEGSIRTVLKKLQQEGLIATNTLGCHLTPQGSQAYRSILGRISPMFPVEGASLTLGGSQVAVMVRSSASEVGSGIDQRDSAIRIGALGATTYAIKSNRFSVPGGSDDCEKDFPSKAWHKLREQFRPKNGDVIIVSGARGETTAKLGALAAALTLL